MCRSLYPSLGVLCEHLLLQKVETDLGHEAHSHVVGKDFLPFKGVEASVRTDVNIIKASAVIAKGTPVHGFVYDVKTGGLTPVQ